MKIGIDSWTIHHRGDLIGVPLLQYVQSLGLDGIQVGNVGQLSPTLDHGELREAADYAREQNLYVEIGIPCPNPHIQDKLALRDGDGDLLSGLQRHLEAAAVAAVGSKAIRCFVGGPGDRHAGHASWSDQVSGTIEVSRKLAPTLREHGLKLAFENHAEATTAELIEVVEAIGSDITGICLDTGNLPIVLEEPLAAVRIAAPYTIATHFKDGIVAFANEGLVFNARACGRGMLPLTEILQEIYRHNPDLMLSIEDHDGFFEIPIFNDEYLATFPHLTPSDLAHVVARAYTAEKKIAAGLWPSPVDAEATPWEERAEGRVHDGLNYVRWLVANLTAAAGLNTVEPGNS